MKIMISIAVLSGLLLGIAALSGVLAADKQAERPRCAECGMFADSSSTRIQAELTAQGKTTAREFCSAGCLHGVLESGAGKTALKSIKVLDYSSFGSKTPQMIDGLTAFYLYDTKPLRGSMLPAIAAFAGKQAALKAKPELGGELLEGWDAVREQLSAGKDD